ncbi:hypothetical protein IF2G_06608 [Cordyceps javanica]|nr:hypothetical protein IF2G_06608 [Cordyceps javanica]
MPDTDALIDYCCARDAGSIYCYHESSANHNTIAIAGAGRAIDFLHYYMSGVAQPRGCHCRTVSGYFDIDGSKCTPDFLAMTAYPRQPY